MTATRSATELLQTFRRGEECPPYAPQKQAQHCGSQQQPAANVSTTHSPQRQNRPAIGLPPSPETIAAGPERPQLRERAGSPSATQNRKPVEHSSSQTLLPGFRPGPQAKKTGRGPLATLPATNDGEGLPGSCVTPA